jgi:hypothetical protein
VLTDIAYSLGVHLVETLRKWVRDDKARRKAADGEVTPA